MYYVFWKNEDLRKTRFMKYDKTLFEFLGKILFEKKGVQEV